MIRKIVSIDEEKCNGCGLCVPKCAEGAIELVDGKARLVSEKYCDGLGACLGTCPQDAIEVEEREAEEFDEAATKQHLAEQAKEHEGHDACPGVAAHLLRKAPVAKTPLDDGEQTPSALGNWPVQLKLVPVVAPQFRGARLLIAADCTPFAFADFHKRFLADHALLIGCPKLDDAEMYRRKLAQLFVQNDIESVEVVHMEVPCCHGLVHLVQRAIADSGKDIPLATREIGIDGSITKSSTEYRKRGNGQRETE